jgi:anti-anti-sigma factor
MKTQIRKNGDTVVVSVNGKINHEAQEPLKQDLLKLVNNTQRDTTARKIIFNFEKLEFVGSSGISNFIQALKDFTQNAPTKPKYCNVGSEFRRVMRALDEAECFEFYENEERARMSFDN